MPHVLVIDDDPQIRELWVDVLSEGGVDTSQAANGVEGVRLAAQNDYDVIVTDLLMPDKDGIETLMEIKSTNPTAKIVVISGSGQVMGGALMDVARELGAEEVLTKPVDIDRFYAVVAGLAGHS